VGDHHHRPTSGQTVPFRGFEHRQIPDRISVTRMERPLMLKDELPHQRRRGVGPSLYEWRVGHDVVGEGGRAVGALLGLLCDEAKHARRICVRRRISRPTTRTSCLPQSLGRPSPASIHRRRRSGAVERGQGLRFLRTTHPGPRGLVACWRWRRRNHLCAPPGDRLPSVCRRRVISALDSAGQLEDLEDVPADGAIAWGRRS